MLGKLFVVGALAVVAVQANYLRDHVVEGGLCDSTVKSLSGYYTVEEKLNKNYFFWLFESRSTPSTDPLIMWLTGGPGCSSQLALLSENGPCSVSADGQTTINNPYGWNTNANIMWVDQPAGVGFSYGTKNDHNETMVGNDMYAFLQEFFTAHPEYAKNEFFVFGESYGGHYAPAIANRIYEGNVHSDGPVQINLAGVGVGNGLTDPLVQYGYYPQMAMNNSYGIKTVSEETYQKMVDRMPTCQAMIGACNYQVQTKPYNYTACEAAYTFCNLVETTPYYNTGLNPYDIRKPCGESSLCYDFTNIETFLNLPSTRAALGVSDEVEAWQSCNTAVDVMFMNDWMIDYQRKLVPLLENNVRVLIYAGDVDFICNWMGNKAWTHQLKWTGHDAFNAEADHDWVHGENVKGGVAKTALAKAGKGSLTFLQVFEAGHMVPMDQPSAALDLLNTFLHNEKFY